MVRQGFLTYFQAAQLLRGKYYGFILGTYLLLERLGSGRTRSVFLGVDLVLRRRVAIEVLPPVPDGGFMAAVEPDQEAAVAELDHPNIVSAYGTERADHYSLRVWEYVDGTSLQDIVLEHGPLDPARAIHYVSQAAEGLQYIHEAGLMHHGICPGNLLLDREGTVKILGPGLPHLLTDPRNTLSPPPEDKTIFVTPAYSAPELALTTQELDIRADIYSLGATLFFLLTGRLPCGDDLGAGPGDAPAPNQGEPAHLGAPFFPEAIRAILGQMMAKDPAQRFSTPADVVDALAPLTNTAVPLPAEREMPQLSPLALHAWFLACNRVQAAYGSPTITISPDADLEDDPLGPDLAVSPVGPTTEEQDWASQPPIPAPVAAEDSFKEGPPPGELPAAKKHRGKVRRRKATSVSAVKVQPFPAKSVPEEPASTPLPELGRISAAARLRALVHRGRRNRPVLVAIAGVFLLVCASGIGIIAANSQGAKEVQVHPVSSEELVNEFLANEVEANKKYLGKLVEIQAPVYKVSSVEVQLEAGKAPRGRVYCAVPRNEQDKVSDFDPGDLIVVKGKCAGVTRKVPGVQLLRCEFRKP
jgi:serine/threonine protein kinase